MATDTLAELAAATHPDLHERMVDVVAALWLLTGQPAPLIRAQLASYLMGERRPLDATLAQWSTRLEPIPDPPEFPPVASMIGKVRLRLSMAEAWIGAMRMTGRLPGRTP